MQAAGLQLGTSCSPADPHKIWAQPRCWAVHWQLLQHLRACELQDSAFSTLLSDGVRCYHGIVACGGRFSTKNRPVAVFFIYGLSGEVSLRTLRRNFLIPPVSRKPSPSPPSTRSLRCWTGRTLSPTQYRNTPSCVRLMRRLLPVLPALWWLPVARQSWSEGTYNQSH